MGFFQDLKEDLSQAVNELVEDETLTEEKVQESDLEEAEEQKYQMIEEEEAEAEVEAEVEEKEEDTDSEEEESIFDTEELDAILTGNTAEVQEENIPETEVPAYIGEGEKMEETRMERDNEISDETAVITKGMTIRGDMVSNGSVDVIGTIEGNIDILGKLNITGVVRGDSKAAEIYAESARITGEVMSEGSVKIGASSVIIGNITATSAVIAGAVKGDIDVHGPVVLDASAIVMGNIKSKSVQINNGAVIEGLCSQCYADVNPSNFFDGLK